MRDAFIRALIQAASRDSRVMLLTADLGYKVFDEFRERCPGRFLNLGVCEANMISVAAGLALEGKRPFTYSIAPFGTIRCLEQIRNDVCMMKLPVIVVAVGAGYAYGKNGPTHHGVDDIGAVRALPGMTVVCPCDPRQVEKAVPALLAEGKPVYLRLGRSGERILPGTDGSFVVGEPLVLRKGREVALLACGSVADEALEAAEILSCREHIDPFVLSVHTVKPLGRLPECLRQARVRHVFTIEEHGPHGGLFEAVCAGLAPLGGAVRVTGLHGPDAFLETCGSQETLRKLTGLDANGIVEAVQRGLEVNG